MKFRTTGLNEITLELRADNEVNRSVASVFGLFHIEEL